MNIGTCKTIIIIHIIIKDCHLQLGSGDPLKKWGQSTLAVKISALPRELRMHVAAFNHDGDGDYSVDEYDDNIYEEDDNDDISASHLDL